LSTITLPTAIDSRAHRIGILAICCMSLFIVGLDNTIVNVALPSIGKDLHATVSGLQWTVDAYTLVLASLLMLSGSMADRFGRRKVFQIGLVTFTIGSLACSLAPSLTWLVVFRMLQAIGGSMLNPVAMSIIRNTFNDSRERAQAIGIWGAVVGVSMAFGPVLGGILVQGVGWRSIFWVNIPVGIAALVLTACFVPESRAPVARRLDPIGQFLVIVTLATLTYGIIEGPRRGWSSALILSLFCAAGVGLVALIAFEGRRREPLLELRFFRSAPFSGATVIAVAAFVGLSGFLFLNTLYLQEVRHLSALHAGIDTLPMAGVTVLMSPLSGRAIGRVGARPSLVLGGLGIGIGCYLLTGLSTTTSFTRLFAAYVIFGIGFGVVNAPITNAAVSGMPPSQAGVASAIASTSRQIGQSLGVAIVGAAAVSSIGRGAIAVHFAPASHLGWWVLTGCGGLVLVLGLLTTTPWAGRTAMRTAAQLEPSGRPHGAPAMTHLLRPAVFASYMALSARSMSESDPPGAGGVGANAIPMLALIETECPSASIRSLFRAESSRSATAVTSSTRWRPKHNTANSSPPSRASTSRSLRTRLIRRATSLSTSSPMLWPYLSLTTLKRSRST
jgi:EmrB/QacA subfamily drug resistance transporter